MKSTKFLLFSMLISFNAVFAAGTPFWWDNPQGYEGWHQKVSGFRANNYEQGDVIIATMDVPNEFDQLKYKYVWVQIEYSVLQGEARLRPGENAGRIRWLNDESLCPVDELEPYPDNPDGDEMLIDRGAFTPENSDHDGQSFQIGHEFSYEEINPQPSCERLNFYFEMEANSEIEYRIEVQTVCFAWDYGDAPDPDFPTLAANNGARHVVVPGFHLGTLIDSEGNGNPDALAQGDDNQNLDDEDGVSFPSLTSITPGASAPVMVEASQEGLLNAWIDFNQNGSWADAGEQIFTNQTLAAGSNNLTFNIPANANLGSVMSRFRFSSERDQHFTGTAPDGEVEDYIIEIEQGLDFGDAPEPRYPTLLASDGARHTIVPGYSLGALIDDEQNGQESPAADGDDNTDSDDEDGLGVSMITITELSTPTITLQVNVPAGTQITVTGWIDYDQNGWQVSERATASRTGSGPVTLTFPEVPTGATGMTFARFRMSGNAGSIDEPTGLAPDGEVEDYQVNIQAADLDFGDAPEDNGQNFHTTLLHDGARHIVTPNFYLGSQVDNESDGQPTISSDGDDNNGVDDEDGVEFPSLPLLQGTTATVEVTVSGSGGILNAWMDLDGSGAWDQPEEHILTDVSVNSGLNTLTFDVPIGEERNIAAHSRFRLSRQAGLDFTGLAPDGEVEDYRIDILFPVELSSFTAHFIDNVVELQWTTQSETENLGFHIYRSIEKEGEYTQITSALIPGAGNSQTQQQYQYTDQQVERGQTYFYKLADVTYSGRITLHEPVEINIAPETFQLNQNYPNPFNPETMITFQLKQAGDTRVAIYNMRGQLVRELLDKDMGSGNHSVMWDGKDNQGKTAPSGTYLYQIESNGYKEAKSMQLIK